MSDSIYLFQNAAERAAYVIKAAEVGNRWMQRDTGHTYRATAVGASADNWERVDGYAIRHLPLSLMAGKIGTGGPSVVFAGGSADGTQLTDSKALTLRWNDDTTSPFWFKGHIPEDFSQAANATLYMTASKTGNTDADDTTFTVAIYNQVIGALHDADTNYGGVTSAMVGTATAKTIQEVSLALALADLPPPRSSITVSVVPDAAVLATDDLCMHDIWIEYVVKNVVD